MTKKNALPVHTLDQKDAIVLSHDRAVDQDAVVPLTSGTNGDAYRAFA